MKSMEMRAILSKLSLEKIMLSFSILALIGALIIGLGYFFDNSTYVKIGIVFLIPIALAMTLIVVIFIPLLLLKNIKNRNRDTQSNLTMDEDNKFGGKVNKNKN